MTYKKHRDILKITKTVMVDTGLPMGYIGRCLAQRKKSSLAFGR